MNYTLRFGANAIATIEPSMGDMPWYGGTIQERNIPDDLMSFLEYVVNENSDVELPAFPPEFWHPKNWTLATETGAIRHIYPPALHPDGSVFWRWWDGEPVDFDAFSQFGQCVTEPLLRKSAHYYVIRETFTNGNVPDEYKCYAGIDLEGEWHESQEDRPELVRAENAASREYQTRHGDCTVVLIRCHA